jgi:hypothetical protein
LKLIIVGNVAFPNILVQNDDGKDMAGPREMLTGSINIDILEEKTETLGRFDRPLHLPLELLNLKRLSLELPID